MTKTVLMVSVGIGRKGMGIAIEPGMIGMKLDTEAKQRFFEEHVTLGKIHVIPKAKQKELAKLDSKARAKFKNRAVSYKWGQRSLEFMTETMYKNFEEEFKVIQNEFYELLEEILDNYDTIKANFLSLFGDTFSNPKEKEIFLKKMEEIIPLKEDYLDDFQVNLQQMTFDLTGKEEIQKRFLGKSLDTAYALTQRLERSFAKNNQISKRSLNAMVNQIPNIVETNVVDDSKIQEIVSMFTKIYNLGGTGANSKKLLKRIKGEILSLAFNLGVRDMLKL